MRQFITTLTLISVLAVAGCSAPTRGDRMMEAGSQAVELGKRWNTGKELIEDGTRLREKGVRQVKEGNENIEKGDQMVREGRDSVEYSERRFNEMKPGQ